MSATPVPAEAGAERLRVGISACLLGVRVRYDGSHKHDPYLTDMLGAYVDWVPVCPEVEVGMSTPRESVRMVGAVESPRLLGVRSGTDWTDRMRQYAHARVAAIRALDLDGYVLKSKSPSCGMERVKVYTEAGMPHASAPGLFARELMAQLPSLPVEEEGRLHDPPLRENFIVRLFCRARWRRLRAQRYSAARLVEFHTRHKLLLMAHSETHMRQLGKLVAGLKGRPAGEALADYEPLFFDGMKRAATPSRHANVLHHIAGYFRGGIPDVARQELADTIDQYRRGLLPLIVPITLLRHHMLSVDQPYLRDQIYLNPHPRELMLLNHV